jgi:hypothetical protein
MRALAPEGKLCNQSVPQRLKPRSAYGIYGTAEKAAEKSLHWAGKQYLRG